ncbi:tyrosine-protein phosphatase 99A-like isoform X1 [Pollicipes pollicipes]|uniref:tyrosine-protein phosphatase 99A-like isoform X1 n=1 Tax=Pollicipes pollicipes TaxID=41117 RepID=UPI001884DBD9|nr:tyrosine-protein phosphatase 99A-like isoform X1 [Pollicipes pollicipes]
MSGRRAGVMWTVLCSVLITLVETSSGAPLDPETIVARTGSRLALSCPGRSAVGDPLLVRWLCRDCGRGAGLVPVAEYSQDGTVSLLVDPDRLQLARRTFQLVMDPALTSDSGTYVCMINNSPSPEYIRVVVQDVPDAPGRPLVTSFASTWANISWAPSVKGRNTPVHHYLVQVREGEAGTWSLLGATVTPDNRTAFTVHELRPYTAYSFRVLGVNDLGQGTPSEPSYFMVTLRQLPSTRPVLVSAHNASANSIELVWRPPASLKTMNGEFLGYQLTYRPVASDPEAWSEADLHGTDVTSFTITGLEPYTEYEIRLQYHNMLGLGQPTVVSVWTDEGEPGSPEGLKEEEIGDTWVRLTWSEPSKPAALIVGYHVYVESEEDGKRQMDGHDVKLTGDHISFNLTGLAPYTEYRVWTCAKSRRTEGRRSTAVDVRTDVSGPGAPLLGNITCRGGSSVYVHWRRPLQLHGTVDFYLVQYRSEEQHEFEELVIPTTASRQEETMFLPNLTMDTMYEVRVVAGTNSLYQPRLTYRGRPSDSRKVYVQENCESLQQQRLFGSLWSLSPGVVAGIACGAGALLLAALALVMWKKYFQAAYNHLDEQNKTPSVISTDWENDSPDGSTAGPIPVHLFPKHVSRLHADGDIGFSKEYEAIQTQTLLDGYTSEYSQHTENKDKNRYLNIVAYDHSRVPLSPLPGQHRCDYVNANFIDGYERPRAYIGTQGPLPDTYAAFWRMVWEQDVHIVVMITNLMERGRKKCDMYWPQEGSETYGVIKVTASGEDVMATYTIRKFKLQHLKSKKPRRVASKTVYQYHYTNWPDHGIPENPLPILSFVRKSAAANSDGAGPIIVHCSAGVGRTGTYILLDSMMRMIRTRGELNVFGFLKYIRTQRNFLVQTEDQYIFVHDALLEAIESGETDIHRSFLSRYLHNLQTTEQDIYPWYNLDRQFKLITYDQATDYDMTSARHPVNYRKNRSMELLPVERYRVCLTPRPGAEGSDYINASWLLGHSRLQEFIVTQHPLVGTVAAFWQMVWDHNAQTAVLLSPVDDQEYCIFWPLEREEIDCDQFRVRFTSERQHGQFVIRDFTLQSFTD